jgi:hypothetical protein
MLSRCESRLLALVAVTIRRSQNLKALVSTWAQKCTETHNTTSCANNTALWLPARLVNVGVGTDTRQARLVVTGGLCPVDHPNVTLSHITEDEFEGLVRANLDDWLKSLPIKDTPELFNAATLAADELSFRYIWIDAICTIQDREIDQFNEISERGQMFQHCSVNITADTVKTFFRMVDPKHGETSQLADGETNTLPTTITLANMWSAEMLCSPIGRGVSSSSITFRKDKNLLAMSRAQSV